MVPGTQKTLKILVKQDRELYTGTSTSEPTLIIILLYCPLLSKKSPKGDVILSSFECLGVILIKVAISLQPQKSSLKVALALSSSVLIEYLWSSLQ